VILQEAGYAPGMPEPATIFDFDVEPDIEFLGAGAKFSPV